MFPSLRWLKSKSTNELLYYPFIDWKVAQAHVQLLKSTTDSWEIYSASSKIRPKAMQSKNLSQKISKKLFKN